MAPSKMQAQALPRLARSSLPHFMPLPASCAALNQWPQTLPLFPPLCNRNDAESF